MIKSMVIGALLHALQGKIVYQRLEPGRKGIYRAVPSALHSSIRLYSRFEYPQGLYAHQSACIESVLAGQNTAICTSTASGKSVAFSFPTMDELLQNHKARALFVYPIKALANDQIIKLQGLAKSLGLNPGIVRKFDGDVHGIERQDALEHGRLLVVTPDVLHTTILRENGQSLYGELFQHLALVILDECHVYSGVFGSNMAYVVRRLRQVCRRHGSDPRFIMASATAGNPYEHFSKLTGLENIKILGPDNDGSPRFDRHFYLVEPQEYVDAYLLRVIAELARRRVRFLVFGQTRQQVERITEQLRLQTPEVGSRVEAYRAGLNAEDRLHIEKAFRQNQLSGLIATSALELGVDLPNLAVCILVGLPGTKASFLQQAGRIGRREEGHVIVLRTESAYDNYYFRNPERLFSKPLEPLALNLDNEPLMIAHYACARAESGHFEAPDLDGDVFGGEFARLAGFNPGMNVKRSSMISRSCAILSLMG
ncbi:ATP-dependent DNA helicase RecQ [Peptococcaceae bacterium CEB3]|nr:ATP-dependent DNA helicase RecQ [Peptococcaceae bacterium CEB3]